MACSDRGRWRAVTGEGGVQWKGKVACSDRGRWRAVTGEGAVQ